MHCKSENIKNFISFFYLRFTCTYHPTKEISILKTSARHFSKSINVSFTFSSSPEVFLSFSSISYGISRLFTLAIFLRTFTASSLRFLVKSHLGLSGANLLCNVNVNSYKRQTVFTIIIFHLVTECFVFNAFHLNTAPSFSDTQIYNVSFNSYLCNIAFYIYNFSGLVRHKLQSLASVPLNSDTSPFNNESFD